MASPTPRCYFVKTGTFDVVFSSSKEELSDDDSNMKSPNYQGLSRHLRCRLEKQLDAEKRLYSNLAEVL